MIDVTAVNVAIVVIATETEIETTAENLTGKENVGGVDHLAITVLEENTTIHILQAVPTEIAKDRTDTPTVAKMPNGTVTEVHEEEMVTDLRAGSCSRIEEVAAAATETETKIAV